MVGIVVNLVLGLASSFNDLLSIPLIFTLMAGSDNESSDQSRQEDTKEPNLPGHREVPSPMEDQEGEFTPVLHLVGEDERVYFPF